MGRWEAGRVGSSRALRSWEVQETGRGRRERSRGTRKGVRVRTLPKVIGVSMKWPSAEESCPRTLIRSLQPEVGMF